MAEQENVCPQAWGGRAGGLARELRRLAAKPPSGVKLLLRDEDLSDVTALIEGPEDTPYAGGVFRVRLSLASFPAAAPRARFETRIFHPNVSAAGEVCVSTLARDWRPELGLAHALLAVRCLLIAPNPDSALNAEAAELLRDRYDDYFARAKLYTEIHAHHEALPPDADTTQLQEAGGATSTVNEAEAGSADSVGGEATAPAPAGEAPRAKRPRGGGEAGPGGSGAVTSRAKERRRILKRL